MFNKISESNKTMLVAILLLVIAILLGSIGCFRNSKDWTYLDINMICLSVIALGTINRIKKENLKVGAKPVKKNAIGLRYVGGILLIIELLIFIYRLKLIL